VWERECVREKEREKRKHAYRQTIGHTDITVGRKLVETFYF
jgi:hypothetical protein